MSPASIALIAAILCVLWAYGRMRRRRFKPPQPPGPRPLPIIGNLHLMGSFPHRTLYELSKKYGPIMSVRLGFAPTVVVSSPEAAELFLKTHDLAFASRPHSRLAEHAFYGAKGVGLCPYGPYWRNARKLMVAKLLNAPCWRSPGKLVGELATMVQRIKRASLAGEVVDLSGALGKPFEAVTYQMIFGEGKDTTFGLKHVVEEMLYLGGRFDVAEFIPLLGPFDPMKLGRRMRESSRNYDRMLETMIEDQLREGNPGALHAEDDMTRGFLGILLSMLDEPLGPEGDNMYIGRNTVKGMLLDMLIAALDTSFTTADWGMSELIRNPRVMKKLQDELARVVGLTRMVDVSDFSNLPYLDMVVKETFRLHPPAPLLVPHESVEDATVAGYFIPKKTRLFINAWAIGRDPNAWPEKTEEFYPERFEHSQVDVQGRDYQLLPFGSGRRACPGWKMGLSGVMIAMAQLVHCFEWELPAGAELDMTEKVGLVVQRANHLKASPRYRLRL